MSAAPKLPVDLEVPDDEWSPRPMSLDAYFDLDNNDPDRKYEFWDGIVVMHPGGTFEHSTVKVNLIVSLGNRLSDGPCRPLDSDMRVEVESPRGNRKGRYVYPDASVYCGEPTFREDVENGQKKLTLTNPVAVFEVTSDSSFKDDHERKLEGYAGVGTLRAYVILSQDAPEVMVFTRPDGGDWRIGRRVGLEGVVPLPAIGIELPMADLYRGVAGPTGAAGICD